MLLTASRPRFPSDRVPVVPGNLPFAAEAAALGTRTLPHVMGSRGAITDDQGHFGLAGLGPGSFGLRITHAGAAALEVSPRSVGEGAQLNFGSLTLPKDGQSPPAASSSPTITAALPQGRRTITGTVKDARGRPLADVALTVRPLEPQAVPVTSATTASNGTYTATGLPDVPLLLRAQHPQLGVMTHTLKPSDQTAHLKYPMRGGIEGEVVDANGRFVSGGHVTLMDADGMPGPTVQLAGAGFRALGVPPGEWIIKVEAPGFSPAETKVNVPSGKTERDVTVSRVRVQVQQISAEK